MDVVVVGTNLPGRRWSSEGERLDDVHVALQVRSEPEGPVPGDAVGGRWVAEVRVVETDDGQVDVRGSAVHGKRGDRFLYLTWGNMPADESFTMFRRAKLMFSDVEPVALRAAAARDATVTVTVDLTDDHGGPRCARVRAPAIEWSFDPASPPFAGG